MKTQYELWLHYITVIVPMAKAAGIDPWECVRTNDVIFKDHPKFFLEKQPYTFALTVLEKTPVFPGMMVYSKLSTDEHNVCGINLDWENWTLTPPTKERTFMLELTEEKLALLIKIPIDQRLFDDPLMFELLKDLQDLNATRSNQNANSVFRQSEQ